MNRWFFDALMVKVGAQHMSAVHVICGAQDIEDNELATSETQINAILCYNYCFYL